MIQSAAVIICIQESNLETHSKRLHESLNGRFIDKCLNEHWFTSLHNARVIIEAIESIKVTNYQSLCLELAGYGVF